MRRGGRGDLWRKGARGDVRRRADRRSGAGDDMPPRIVGMHDEAERFGGGGKGRSCLLRQADDHERPARRRAHPTRSRRLGGFGQSLQRHCIGMAEREADAIRECTVTQRMQADGLVPLILADAGLSGSDKQVFNGGAEYGDALRRNYVARARVAASLRQRLQADVW